MKTWINTEASVQYLVGEKDDKAKVKINYRKWRKITVRQEIFWLQGKLAMSEPRYIDDMI